MASKPIQYWFISNINYLTTKKHQNPREYKIFIFLSYCFFLSTIGFL